MKPKIRRTLSALWNLVHRASESQGREWVGGQSAETKAPSHHRQTVRVIIASKTQDSLCVYCDMMITFKLGSLQWTLSQHFREENTNCLFIIWKFNLRFLNDFYKLCFFPERYGSALQKAQLLVIWL